MSDSSLTYPSPAIDSHATNLRAGPTSAISGSHRKSYTDFLRCCNNSRLPVKLIASIFIRRTHRHILSPSESERMVIIKFQRLEITRAEGFTDIWPSWFITLSCSESIVAFRWNRTGSLFLKEVLVWVNVASLLAITYPTFPPGCDTRSIPAHWHCG